MVRKVIGIVVSLLAVHSVYGMKREGVTIYIGKNEPCKGTVTFTYDTKNGYKMVVLLNEATDGVSFGSIRANVLPGYEGFTETMNLFIGKRFGTVTEGGKVLTFTQVQIEPEDIIVVAGEAITAVRGVFEPKSKKFIILKSTLNKEQNSSYKTLKKVKQALQKGVADNISKVAHIIRQGGADANNPEKYYTVNVEFFQDSDFQKSSGRNQEEKTLILNFTQDIAKLASDEAQQVHWIKINKNTIAGKIDDDVYKCAQSMGQYIEHNKNRSIGITCVKKELATLITACEKSKPIRIEIWGPLLSWYPKPRPRFTWEELVTAKPEIRKEKIVANFEPGENPGSITLQASDR